LGENKKYLFGINAFGLPIILPVILPLVAGILFSGCEQLSGKSGISIERISDSAQVNDGIVDPLAGRGDGLDKDVCGNPTVPVFKNNILPLFTKHQCATCHYSGGGAAGLSFDPSDYPSSITEAEEIAKTQISKWESAYASMASGSMPKNLSKASSCDLELFASWISRAKLKTANTSCASMDGLLEPKVRRLTLNQFKNTMSAVFGNIFTDDLYPNLGDAFPTIGLSNNPDELEIHNLNFETLFNSMDELEAKIIEENSDFNICKNSADLNCFNALVDNYSPLAWRKPVSSPERDAIKSEISNLKNQGGTGSNLGSLLVRILVMAPDFLYRTEIGPGMVNVGDVVNLNDHEIASYLSYSLWDSPPDSTLRNLANLGQLANVNAIRQQTDRMMLDPRFNSALVEFFDDFLKLENVVTIEKDPSLNFDLNSRKSLLVSAKKTLENSLSNHSSNYMDVFTSDKYFINNTTASYFNENPASYSNTFQLNTVANAKRKGIIFHPAFLSAHAGEKGTSIVKRGVFTLEQMLCYQLGNPPASIPTDPVPADIDPDKTSTRDLLQITHSSKPDCIGCHVKIDPAGFGLENFDTLGLYRTTEKDNVPIDSSGEIALGEELISFVDGLEFSEKMAASESMKSCVQSRYFENITGQSASTTNWCELDKYKLRFATTSEDIQSLVRAMMDMESFIKRKVR